MGHLFVLGCFMLSISSTAQAQNRNFKNRPTDVELLIQQQNLVAENNDNSREFNIQSVLVNSYMTQGPLDKILRIGDGFQQLTIKVQQNNGEYSILDLPESVKTQLLKYLMNPPEPCDCNCFAHAINNVKFKMGIFDDSSWMITKFVGESYLYPGDTIYIEKAKDTFTHFAVYLGQGLYISKFGYRGPLIVTSLEAMKYAYDADQVWIIRPRR